MPARRDNARRRRRVCLLSILFGLKCKEIRSQGEQARPHVPAGRGGGIPLAHILHRRRWRRWRHGGGAAPPPGRGARPWRRLAPRPPHARAPHCPAPTVVAGAKAAADDEGELGDLVQVVRGWRLSRGACRQTLGARSAQGWLAGLASRAGAAVQALRRRRGRRPPPTAAAFPHERALASAPAAAALHRVSTDEGQDEQTKGSKSGSRRRRPRRSPSWRRPWRCRPPRSAAPP